MQPVPTFGRDGAIRRAQTHGMRSRHAHSLRIRDHTQQPRTLSTRHRPGEARNSNALLRAMHAENHRCGLMQAHRKAQRLPAAFPSNKRTPVNLKTGHQGCVRCSGKLEETHARALLRKPRPGRRVCKVLLVQRVRA